MNDINCKTKQTSYRKKIKEAEKKLKFVQEIFYGNP